MKECSLCSQSDCKCRKTLRNFLRKASRAMKSVYQGGKIQCQYLKNNLYFYILTTEK